MQENQPTQTGAMKEEDKKKTVTSGSTPGATRAGTGIPTTARERLEAKKAGNGKPERAPASNGTSGNRNGSRGNRDARRDDASSYYESSDDETTDPYYLPGAVHVPGPREGDGDETIAVDSTTTHQVSAGNTSSNAGSTDVAMFDGEVVEDIESRVRARVENRLINQAVEATGVQVINEGGEEDASGRKKGKDMSETKRSSQLLVIGCIAVVALIVILALFVGGGDVENNLEEDPQPAPAPTEMVAVTPTRDIVIDLLVDNGITTDKASFDGDGSVQSLALDWLLDEENTITYAWLNVTDEDGTDTGIVDLMIIERYSAAVLFYSLTSNLVDNIEEAGEGASTTTNNGLLDLGWMSKNSSICDWNIGGQTGIHCNTDDDSAANGFVEQIVLHVVGVNGTFPSTELAGFTRIKELSGRRATVMGTIPSEIGLLTSLDTLKFPDNLLTGPIPTEISRLSNMRVLFFWVNYLTGTIPHDIFQTMTDLEHISLAENWLLSGTIPEFGYLDDFTGLELDINILTGTIPSSMYDNLPRLDYVRFDRNKLSGTIPTEIAQLSNLEWFNYRENDMMGTLPTELGLLSNVEVINLSGNNFNGTIPSEIAELRRMRQITLDDNQLSGTVPSLLAQNLVNLEVLSVASNPDIVGTIPAGFADSTNLPYLFEMDFFNTSLDSNAFDAFCIGDGDGIEDGDGNDGTVRVFLKGDCLPMQSIDGDDSDVQPEPEIMCDCCAECSNDVTGETELNLQSVCELKANAHNDFDDSRGATCGCPQATQPLEGGGREVQCSETCETCTTDGTTCFQNFDYGLQLDDSGSVVRTFATFVYTKGKLSGNSDGGSGNNSTVSTPTVVEFEDNVINSNINVPACSVKVNGESCEACALFSCRDGTRAWTVDCTNLKLGSGDLYDPCVGGDGVEKDTVDKYGALTVFAMQDSFLRESTSCKPWLVDIGEDYFDWFA